VTQSGVNGRTFNYSSLGRLLNATNPESGFVSYTYDPNGNVQTRVRNGVTTTNSYNELDQITDKIYSDYNSARPTPWVHYGYNKGWLTSVTAGCTIYQYTAFDALGRVTSSQQTTNNFPYTFQQYTYNLIDGITSMTLPSGRAVYTSNDSAGRPICVSGSPNCTGTQYASQVSYAPHGAIQQLTLGNLLVEQTCYNPRLQPVAIRLGASATANCANAGADPLNLFYDYGTTLNNGNLLHQTISRGSQGWYQTYLYDGVNRLTYASEANSFNLNQVYWTQNYNYSPSGNRAVTGYLPNSGGTPQYLTEYDTNNRWLGAVHDAAGNQTTLPTGSFTYDAENRLTTATESYMPAISYSYDGDGRRVTKTVGTASTVFVYDAQGQLAAEYSTVPPTVAGTLYLTPDHLGSTRLVTGGTQQCFDYLPFGEELANGTFGRGSCFPNGMYPINPSPDAVTEKFTGKERDAETGLDYFGARYMSAAQGRFTGTDPSSGTILHVLNPQRWNMYAYALNNPLLYTDPTGRDAINVNFKKEVPFFGHNGIVAVDRKDGSAMYARLGPDCEPCTEGPGVVRSLLLKTKVEFQSDGLPTDASYRALTKELARTEGQDPATVRMNYFITSDAETAALKHWISWMQSRSDSRNAPYYQIRQLNCAVFCIGGLITAGVLGRESEVYKIPNLLFGLLSNLANENYENGRHEKPKKVKACVTTPAIGGGTDTTCDQ
jgi:RHS repeat-associated protein